MKYTKQLISQFRKRAFPILLLASLTAVAAPLGGVKGWFSASAATTFTVNSTGDGADSNLGDGLCNDGAGNCTLRAAIQQANTLAGADTIQFSVTGTINLTGPLPDLSTAMTIMGPGMGLLTVHRDTGGDYRVLTVGIANVSNVTVSISGLTVSNGKTADGANTNTGTAGSGQVGGGVLNYSTLTMTDVAVTGNRTGAGGVSPVFGGEGGDGGGVFNAGTLTMNNCSVTGNFTGNGGEGNNGGGNGGEGGGILNANLLTMTGGSVSNNTTGTAGSTFGIGRTGGRGGGIFSAAVLNLTGVSVSNNKTGDGSPGANAFGGHGGGLYLDGGSATMTSSTVSGNTTGQSPMGTNGYGGGIENSAALTVRNSTISGNTGNAGGAILNRLALNMTNSTVSGNRLTGSGGGAINSSDSSSSLRLTNSTIAFNDGSGVHGNTGSGYIRNTIIARNAGGGGPDAAGSFTSQGHNLVGNADGSVGFTAAGDQIGTSAAPINPLLGPLADNGGPTFTHALLTGSPALDAGNNALALDPSGSTLTTDQRGPGYPRFVDSDDPDTVATVDIGAYEKGASTEPINDAPTFTKGPDRVVPEDAGPQTVTGWATGISPGPGDTGQTVTFIVTGNTNPALFSAGPAISPDGTLTFMAAGNASGSATITVVLKDNGGTANGGQDTSAPQSFVITVTSVNDAPVAANDAYNANEDTPLNVLAPGVLANDADIDSASLTASRVTLPANGTLTLNANGSFTYTPNANFNGTDSFTYRASDGAAQSNTVAVTITVNPVNDAPTANPQSVNTNEDTPKNITLNGSDTEGSPLTYTVVTQPAFGTLSGVGANLTYTPNANFNGADSFTFKVNDGSLDSAPATVSITVTAVNDAPSAASQSVNTDEDTPKAVTLSATDVDGDALTFAVVTGPSHGTLSGSGPNLTYTPNVNFNGTDSFTFRASDGTSNSDTATVTITVGAVNDAPSAVNDSYQTAQNSPLTVAAPGVLANDADADGGATLTAARVTGPSNGTLTLNTNGSFTYTPSASFSGTDSFTYKASDGAAESNTATVTISVSAGGSLRLSAAAYEVNEAVGSLTITVTRTDGSAGAATVAFATSNGTATAGSDYTSASGTLSFAAGETSKTFSVSILDDSVNESDETFMVKLSNVTGSASLGGPDAATVTIRDNDPSGGRFEFAQATFRVAERGGGITIQVRRTGDVSRAASVGYLTDDGAGNSTSTPCSSTGGTALSRCDFTLAIGRLDFAAGETEKTFEILITDDSYFEGTESLTLRLDTPEGGAVLAQQATASLQITDDAPESSGNPVDNAADFVRQHYHDFFGRQPDASGLAFWTNQITECGTNAACIDNKRQNVSAAFFLSIEFQETGYLVYRAHRASFDDLPGASWPVEMPTLLSEVRRIGAGVIVGEGDWQQRLEQNKQAYFSWLVQTEGFTQQFPQTMTPQQFVEKMNQNADGALSQAERDDLINKLAANQFTRAQVVRAVAEDQTLYDAEYRRAFVYMQYAGYLRRDPDQGGGDFWLGKLNSHNGNYISSEMVRSFLVSGEYRDRFGR